MIEELRGFRGERKDSSLIAFACDADLGFRQQHTSSPSSPRAGNDVSD